MYRRRNMVEARDSELRPKNVCTAKYAVKKARAGVRLSRWELEEVARDSSQAYQYALHVAKGRWLQGEACIMGSTYMVSYASDVVGGRWVEAESSVVGHGSWALSYCRNVLKGRWEEAEPAILGDYGESMGYFKEFVRGRWGLLEEKILSFMEGVSWGPFCYRKPMDAVRGYMRVVGERVPLWEEGFGRFDWAGCMYCYVRGLGGVFLAGCMRR